jgi:arylsulfatase A-like enzyme
VKLIPWCLACVALPIALAASTAGRPNFVLILADDLGYADLGCYGATDIRTPNLDRLAKDGVRCTDFYAENVCTPARAALMTGAYPKRVGLHRAVLPPNTTEGLHPDEITLAELLKGRGYTTAAIGKWHLGLRPEVLPTAQGFDSYFGLPGPNHGASDLYRGTEVIEKRGAIDLDQLTQRYTAEAVRFIREHKDRPFFLYLAHSATHVPRFASAAFRGKSAAGLQGDMTEELDWSCGEVFRALHDCGSIENTVVLFISDERQPRPTGPAAPWRQRQHLGGRIAGPLPGSLAGPYPRRHRSRGNSPPSGTSSPRSPRSSVRPCPRTAFTTDTISCLCSAVIAVPPRKPSSCFTTAALGNYLPCARAHGSCIC